MKKIASFQVDHTKLDKGLYISRVDGDVVSYDLRMCKPNAGDYLTNAAAHTFEHLLATFARSSELADQVVYVGPMGCLTGFYLLTRDTVSHTQVIELLQRACAFIRTFEGEIPGNREAECGNFRMHDLTGARALASAYAETIRDWTPEKMVYTR